MSVVRFISVNTVQSADNRLKILFGSRFGSLFYKKTCFCLKNMLQQKTNKYNFFYY